MVHDSFFFAADEGGGIEGIHVDFFLGFAEQCPFSFVTSNFRGIFDSKVVANLPTINHLRNIHLLSESTASITKTPIINMNASEKEQLYTIRWYIREKWGEASAKNEVMDLLGKLIDPASTPEERPSVSQPGGKLLWCPFAERSFPRSRTQGSYARGSPLGAIVHFTAGRRSGLETGMNEQVENGFTYFVIDKDGNIGQNFSLDSWGSHAGASSFPGLSGRVSDDLVGIEIQAAGKLRREGTRWVTWFGEAVPAGDTRTVASQTANQEAGT